MATNVGSIYVVIKGDDTQWKKDMAALKTAATKSGKEVSESLNSGISSKQASAGIRTITTGLTQLSQTAKIPEKQFKQTAGAITNAMGDVARSVGLTDKEFARLNEKMLRNKAMQSATNELRNLTRAADLSAKETKQMAVQMGYSSKEAQEMADKIHRVSRESDTLSKAMNGLYSVMGIVAGAAGMGYIANQSLAATAEMQKNAEIAGVTAQAYQELSFAVSKYQVTQDALTDGMKELSLRADEFVVTGAGPAKEAFERLGFSQSELNKKMKDTPALLLDIIDRMEGLDQAAKIRIADEIFGGTGGEQFVSMINAGSGAIEDLTKKANDLGLVMSDETASGATEAYNAIKTLTSQLENQFNTVIAELAPDIESIAKQTSEWVKANKDFLLQDIPGHIKKIKEAVSDFALSDTTKKFLKIMTMGGILRTGDIGLIAFLKDFGVISEDTRSEVEKLEDWLENLKKQFELAPTPMIKNAIEDVEKQLLSLKMSLRNPDDWEAMRDQIVNHFKDVKKAVDPATKANNDYIKKLKEIAEAEKILNDLLAEGKKVTMEMRTPTEQLADETANLGKLFGVGAISAETYAMAIAKAQDEIKGSIVDTALEDFFGDIDKAQEDWIEEQKDVEKETIETQKSIAQAQKDAYDDLYDTMKGYTRDVIDDFDSMGDTLVGLADNIAKDIAAAFLTQNIVMPITLAAGSALGLTSSNGTPYSDVAGGSGTDFMSMLSGGNTLYKAITGGISAGVESTLSSGLIGSLGTSAFGSAWGGATASTYLAGSGGSMISVNSGLAGGVLSGGVGSSTGIVGALSAAAPYLAAAAVAIPFIMSALESEPEPRIGIRKGDISEYGYNPTTKDMSNQEPINDYIVEYFDAYFSAIDELTSNAVKDVLADTDWERIRVHPEDFDSVEDAIFAVSDDVFKKFADGFIAGLGDGQFSDFLDADFFESIQADGESLLDTFINFGIVVEATDDFIGQFTRQIDEFGESTKSAYENVVVITDIMGQVGSGVSSITDVSSITNINTLTDSWHGMIDTLESVNATVGQVTTAQTGMAQVLGANITGLTANALQSALSSGGDIDSIIKTSIQSATYADIAQKIADGYISGLNEEIGRVWIDTGGDIKAVVAAMNRIDTTSAQKEIESLQESFGVLAENIEDVSESSNIVALAINGQLNAAQQFAAWQIENAQALSLFTEMTAAGVTKKELEGAIDAFVDLGIEGDSLKNVIGSLADAFTAATDEMFSNISDIESAQGNLNGETETYLNKIKSVLNYFKDVPSIGQIRGDEVVQDEIFNEDAYKRSVAEYVVNQEFERLLGRSGDNYWVDQLLNHPDVTFSNIADAIIVAAKEAGDSLIGSPSSGESWRNFDTAAQIAGIKESDFISYKDRIVQGEFSTSDSEIAAAIEKLESLPDVLSNGRINKSELNQVISTLGGMSSAVLEDIFGSGAASKINSLASAVNDYESAISSAGASTKTAYEEINTSIDDYLKYLQIEIDTRQDVFDSAMNALEDYIDSEERLIEARKSASASIETYINELLGSTSAPVQSMEFFEKRYSQLLDEAKNAGPDDISSAVSTLTSFASNYLDFANSYGGDYASLFDSVVSDLKGVGQYQDAEAYVQGVHLGGIRTRIGDEDEATDINSLLREFVEAQSKIDDAAWMTDELDKLGSIDDNISLLYAAQIAYYDSIGQERPDEIKQSLIEAITRMGKEIGFVNGEMRYSFPDYGNIYLGRSSIEGNPEQAAEYFGLDLNNYRFADGGIISGPLSGYQLPNTTFHGDEAIIPLKSGAIPVQLNGDSGQNITVVVKIGNKEIKDITTEVIRTNPTAQHYIKRAANG